MREYGGLAFWQLPPVHMEHDGSGGGGGLRANISGAKILRRVQGRVRVQDMNELDAIKKVIAPFLIHGICTNEMEALQMLAKDYVQRQVIRYAQRVEHFRTFYQTSVEQFAKQVAALCRGDGQILALSHMDRQEQVVRAEDDLEEWQAAEQYLAHWQAVEADLQHAPTA